MSPDQFCIWARRNPINAALLDRLPAIGLRACYLTAGSLFQSTWNVLSERAADHGVKDYDVFYFDDRDLSWEAENEVVQRVQRVTTDLAVTIDIKNQARVHLWYAQRFGVPYPQLSQTTDGIDRFLIACTCVGIEVGTGALYAPNGLDDLRRGILRPNPKNRQSALFIEKAEDYRRRWPWLSIAPV